MDIYEYIRDIGPVKKEDLDKYRAHWDSLVHPTGSLGEIEEIGIRVCGILGELPESIDKKVTLVMCSDNGIVEENVSSSPKILTKLLALQMATGTTGVCALSESAGSDLAVVDLGIEDFEGHEGIIDRKISNGTKNFAREDAMTYDQALESIGVGIEIAESYIGAGYRCLGTGELGIGNTSTSAAVIKALTGAEAEEVVGLGSGVDDIQLANKVRLVDRALDMRRPNLDDPIDVLVKIGGYDIGAIAGVFLACAKHGVPGIIDGIISGAGALLAARLCSNAGDYMLGSHIPKEQGSILAMEDLGVRGYLDCSMRLGEGSGCPLMFKVIDSALYCMNKMTRFEETDIKNTLVNLRDKK